MSFNSDKYPLTAPMNQIHIEERILHLWPLTFSFVGLGTPLHQVWKKNRSSRLVVGVFDIKMYIWPSVTWPLTLAAVTTAYFGSDLASYHMSEVQYISVCIFLENDILRNLTFDIWSLIYDLLLLGFMRRNFPPWGIFPRSVKKTGAVDK